MSFSRWWRATLAWRAKRSATSDAVTPSLLADEEVDLAPGGVAERVGDRGDRGVELVGRQVLVRRARIGDPTGVGTGGVGAGRIHGGYSTYVRSGNPPGSSMAPRSRRFGERFGDPELRAALGAVEEPVLELPIGDLGMVQEVAFARGTATVGLASRSRPTGRRSSSATGSPRPSPAPRGRPGRDRDPRDGRRRAGGGGRGPARRPAARPAPGRRRVQAGQQPHPHPVEPVHRLPTRVHRGRVGQGRRREVVGHDQPVDRARRSAASRSRPSTPTCGASRCRGCSASPAHPHSSTT